MNLTKNKGEIVAGEFNDYGFFSIQNTGDRKYHVNVNNKVYEELPIVEIEDWNDITEEWLDSKFNEITQGKFKYERLFLNYWVENIKKI